MIITTQFNVLFNGKNVGGQRQTEIVFIDKTLFE